MTISLTPSLRSEANLILLLVSKSVKIPSPTRTHGFYLTLLRSFPRHKGSKLKKDRRHVTLVGLTFWSLPPKRVFQGAGFYIRCRFDCRVDIPISRSRGMGYQRTSAIRFDDLRQLSDCWCVIRSAIGATGFTYLLVDSAIPSH
jgi:hypothetical protein